MDFITLMANLSKCYPRSREKAPETSTYGKNQAQPEQTQRVNRQSKDIVQMAFSTAFVIHSRERRNSTVGWLPCRNFPYEILALCSFIPPGRPSGTRPVSGVTVTLSWSGIISGSNSARTDASGNAVVNLGRTKKSGTLTASITHVTPANGAKYEPSLSSAPLARSIMVK